MSSKVLPVVLNKIQFTIPYQYVRS